MSDGASRLPMVSQPVARCKGILGHDFSPVFEVLEAFCGERVVFCPNGGNAGDSIINCACYGLLEDLGIDYELARPDGRYAGRIIVHGGGGSLVEPYVGSRDFIARHHATCKAFILLPHTVRAYGELFRMLDRRCILFAREDGSRRFLEQHARRATVLQCHDMAFRLGASSYALRRAFPRLVRTEDGRLRRDLRLRGMVKAGLFMLMSGGRLKAWRRDNETAGHCPPRWNIDISGRLIGPDMSPQGCVVTTAMFFSTISLARRVTTDRLHVGIAAALLGKRTELYDNSYGKVGDVYRFSMAELPHVRFHSAVITADSPR